MLSLFVREALRALSRNKLRSALSVIGITIGIAAVVCVVAIGAAGSQRAEEQLRATTSCGSRPVPATLTGYEAAPTA
jgi:hypothetical protein